jgi:hypothetical protein
VPLGAEAGSFGYDVARNSLYSFSTPEKCRWQWGNARGIAVRRQRYFSSSNNDCIRDSVAPLED